MDPERKIVKARTRMLSQQPFWGTLALKFPLIKGAIGGTLETNGKVIRYDEDFVDKISFKHLVFGVAHEIGHVMFLHPARMGDRIPMIANIAQDYAVNALLQESGFHMPDFALHDPKYKNWSWEEIYNDLLKQMKESDQGDGGDDGNDKQWSVKDFQGNGDGTDKCCGGVQKMPAGDGTDEGKGHGKTPSKAEIDALEADIKDAIQQAAFAAKQAGKMPAGLERFIDDLVMPKVNWKEQLHRFVDNAAKNDYSWTRPNRRYLYTNTWLPSLHRPELDHCVVVVDTSGSISGEILRQFASEISAALETVELNKLTVLYCDTQVGSNVEEFTKTDLPLRLHPQGGGGTMFSPAFNYVDEHQMEPTVLIYLTDLWCNDYPDYVPEYPVIWACSDHYGAQNYTPPFGEVVLLDEAA